VTCYRNASIERLTWGLIYNCKTKKSYAQPQKDSAFREYFANYSRTKALRNILKQYLEFSHMNLLPGKFFPKKESHMTFQKWKLFRNISKVITL
jgi:type II secretory pathway component PulL